MEVWINRAVCTSMSPAEYDERWLFEQSRQHLILMDSRVTFIAAHRNWQLKVALELIRWHYNVTKPSHIYARTKVILITGEMRNGVIICTDTLALFSLAYVKPIYLLVFTVTMALLDQYWEMALSCSSYIIFVTNSQQHVLLMYICTTVHSY